jgi:hypothetical protein
MVRDAQLRHAEPRGELAVIAQQLQDPQLVQ